MNETERIIYEARVCNQMLQYMEKELVQISYIETDLKEALNALDNIADGEKQVFVPIGSNFFVNLNKQEAQEELKKRISSVESADKKAKQEIEKLRKKAVELNAKVAALTAGLKNKKSET